MFAPPADRIPSRGGRAAAASVLGHAGAVLLAMFIASLVPQRVYESVLPERLTNLVWVSVPGPGGGGGGGGNEMPEPKPVELPKVEAPKPPAPTPEPVKVDPPPPPDPVIPAQTPTIVPEIAPGIAESTLVSIAQGVGTGGGADTGQGAGIGSGRGAGLGAGFDRGVGGGAYRPGNGVEIPKLLSQVRPQYTAEAMRARMQGVVQLECIVTATGSVGNCEITRSLDGNNFGLDEQALQAARKWRFIPGTRFGEPVPVLVTIELTFTLR